MKRTSHDAITKHRNVEIFVSEDGTFFTRNESEYGHHEAPTLDALKRLLDKLSLVQGPERAFYLDEGWYNAAPQILFVKCGKLINVSYRDDPEVWVTSLNSKERSKRNAAEVYLDTSSNIALADEWIQAKIAEKRATAHAETLKEALVPVSSLMPKTKP